MHAVAGIQPGREPQMELLSRQFLSDLRQLAEIRAFVRQACERAWGPDVPEKTLDLLELAVTEAATNIGLHAYEGANDQPIEVVIDAGPDEVRISLLHCGKDFDREAVPAPVLDGQQESGYGLYLMKQAVDELYFLRDERGRYETRLVKKRPKH